MVRASGCCARRQRFAVTIGPTLLEPQLIARNWVTIFRHQGYFVVVKQAGHSQLHHRYIACGEENENVAHSGHQWVSNLCVPLQYATGRANPYGNAFLLLQAIYYSNLS